MKIISKFVLIGSIGLTLVSGDTYAQDFSLNTCRGIFFSSEEDFLNRGRTPADGNPLVSDGDLLATNLSTGNTFVCARNIQLVRRFDVQTDLGLDAVDDIAIEEGIVAFSTEPASWLAYFCSGNWSE